MALEVRRKLVSVQGAKDNYAVCINPITLELDVAQTEILRADMETSCSSSSANDANDTANDTAANDTANGADTSSAHLYNRGGTLAEIAAKCLEETGFEAPVPQWEEDVYGPHVALPYVREWYRRGKEVGYEMWGV